MKLDPINNGKEFEHLCKWVARENYGPNVFLYDRHSQNGIDIYWTKNGKYSVVQCKQRNSPNPSELISALEHDFDLAKTHFKNNLKRFIFATTASLEIIETKVKRKTGITESVLDVCNRLSLSYSVDVHTWHWNYLEEKVLESRFLLRHLLNRDEGADLINDSFIESQTSRFIGKNDNECKLKYYGGQEDIQWYGIQKKWDAQREIYESSINEIHASFNKSEPVAYVVRGEGGSGKSVFLRRLGFDLKNDYTIYWLGANIESFLANEFVYDILRHTDNKYLIILEDWYRNIDRVRNKTAANQLLNALKKSTNVKLVIGDRKDKKKIYDDFVYSSNIHDLSNSENLLLLREVFMHMPQWKGAVDTEVLQDITKSTLFIALFVFCYGEDSDKESLTERYRRIFKSDFNKYVDQKEPFWHGLVKALYIYANHYVKFGITLLFESLVELASFYGNCSIPSIYKDNINRLLETPLFKKYLHIELFNFKNAGIFRKVRFHHDTMAEQGWAIEHESTEVEYDENSILDLKDILKRTDLMFDLRGLYGRLIGQRGELGKKEAREYLTIDRPDKNQHVFCASINLLREEDIATQAARDFLKTNRPYINEEAFSKSLDVLRTEELAKQAARDFLKIDNPYLESRSFGISLELLKGEKIAEQAARDFLKTDNPHIHASAFNKSLDLFRVHDFAKQAARRFLETDNPHVNHSAFNKSLDLLRTEESAQKAVRDFLKTNNPYLNHWAFSKSIELTSDEELTKQAARRFLKTDNPHVNHSVFNKSLELLKGEKIAEQAARDFLQTDNPYLNQWAFNKSVDLFRGKDFAKQATRDFLERDDPHLNFSVYCKSLELHREEDFAKQKARVFFETDNPHSYPEAFAASMRILDVEVEDLAIKVLKNHKNEDSRIVMVAIRILCKVNKFEDLLKNIVIEIVKNKIKVWHNYRYLLSIPLFNVPEWRSETEDLIRNWRREVGTKRNNLYFVSLGYEGSPEKLKEMSIGIIRNWRRELGFSTKHKAYFTRCLANINVTGDEKLKREVVQICRDICDSHDTRPLNLTSDLLDWLKKITTTGDFPSWSVVEKTTDSE